MKLQYQMSNGNWADCQDRMDYFLGLAVKTTKLSLEEITAKLETGAVVRIGSGWNDEIRCADAYAAKLAARRAAATPVKMVKCSCGHTIPSISVMSTSTGSSCPDCYDRMSN